MNELFAKLHLKSGAKTQVNMSESSQHVDLQKVSELFSKSLKESDDVFLELYLDAYLEFNKFFNSLGILFDFVSKEINDKITIMHQHLKSSDGGTPTVNENFESIIKMIDHEKSNQLLGKSNYVSGSRTLLRLHRGLDFIRVFLKGLQELQPTDNVKTCCSNAYSQTLGNFHSWFIRQGVYLAMFTMPTQNQLLITACGNEENRERSLLALPKMLSTIDEVYERTQKLYETHKLLNLE